MEHTRERSSAERKISQVSGAPSEVQSDDGSSSTFLESTLNQYVKPYTDRLVEKVTDSFIYDAFERTINGVQGVFTWTGGYLQAYYQDHLKAPTENTMQWIGDKTKRVRERFQGTEQ
ncbi:hypothetical protein GDO78_011026 [Eleutherodactylus coqui]|uniref:Uncharacterized protein n=1 Tax=Eleutherodactylus coqui TaxID=57060 RepID=A0A8J6F7Q1_ELECQ|nr:hypothetical protein GDO78_011026 [Eleutherodactylus coqui]